MCIEAHNRSQLSESMEVSALGKPDSRKRKRRECQNSEAIEGNFSSDAHDLDPLVSEIDAVTDPWTAECENLTQKLISLRPKAHKIQDLEATRAEAQGFWTKVQAVGCEDVMNHLRQMSRDDWRCDDPHKSHAAAIAGLLRRATKRLFQDHVLVRMGSALLLQDITDRVETIRQGGLPSTQILTTEPLQGYAITRAYEASVKEAYPELEQSERRKCIKAYKEWAIDGKIGFNLYRHFGLAILLLIPAGHANDGKVLQ